MLWKCCEHYWLPKKHQNITMKNPMEHYQSRLLHGKFKPSENWLVSWGGFVDFLFQPLPLICRECTLEKWTHFLKPKLGFGWKIRCVFFCCSLGGEFLWFISRFILKSFCFERKILSEDFGGICQVVNAQAYALHCGRIDVCFRFASPLNRLMTGVSGTAWLVVGARMILYMKAFI